MNSADKDSQSLVYADGYSYTEIFQAPETLGMPSSGRLVSIFHAFFTADRDTDLVEASTTASAPTTAVEMAIKNT